MRFPLREAEYLKYISENVSLYPYLSGLENLDYLCKLNGKNLPISELRKLLEKFVTEPLIELILNDEFKSDFLFSAIILD